MKLSARGTLVLFVVLGLPAAARAPSGQIAGRVTDHATGEVVAGAAVFVDGKDTSVTSDRGGWFRVAGLAVGPHVVTVVKEGYDAASGLKVEVRENRDAHLDVVLRPFTLETVVEAVREDTLAGVEDTLSSNQLLPEDVQKMAGGMGDVNKMLHTMPGVVAESDLGGAMYVRGGDALETMTFLDRAFLWNPYHLGGFNSLFSPNLIDTVDFYAGGFPARYPNALSAVVDVTYRNGRAGPLSGSIDISTVDATLLAEGSLGDEATFIAEARRTYFDLVTDTFRDTAVPFYEDYYGRVAWIPETGRTLTGSVLFARDGLEIAGVTDDGDWRNGFTVDPDDEDRGTLFFGNDRLLGQVGYTQLFGEDTLWDTTVSYLDERTRSDLKGSDPFAFDVHTKNLFLFSDLSRKLSGEQLLEGGVQYAHFDFVVDSVLGDFRSVVPWGRTTAQGDVSKVDVDVAAQPSYGGAYVQHRWQPAGKVELRTGLRADYWSDTGSITVSPRVDLRYHVAAETSLRFAWGIFHQIPANVLQSSEGFGNPDLGQERSIHYVAGLKQGLPGGSLLRAEIYWKQLDDLVVNPDNPDEVARRIPSGTAFVNEGEGRSYGAELFLQKEHGRFTGWITYGYAVTRRKNPLNAENPTWYAPLQDQRHTLSAVASYRIGEKWTVGGKAQLHTGKPDTEVVAWELGHTEEDPPEPEWVAVYGPVNGDRFPSYYKIDLRVERAVRLFGMEGSVHLDVLNATNRKNLYVYSYTAGDPPSTLPERREVHAMPFLPYLGLSLRF